MTDLCKLQDAELSLRKAIEIKPYYATAAWNLHGLSNSIEEAEERINECLKIDNNYIRAILIKSALKLHQSDQSLFDNLTKKSKKDRPFYEFGVWRGESFKYLINIFKKGYGFDTFEGLPEDWHDKKTGTYSAERVIPKIDGGTFIAGKFEETLPTLFAESRPVASIINFDADLYSSTLCALNY